MSDYGTGQYGGGTYGSPGNLPVFDPLPPAAARTSGGSPELSGIFFAQNQTPTNPADKASLNSNDWAFQEFIFPSDYIRGTETSERIVPAMTGIQVCVTIAEGYAHTATLDYRIDRYGFGAGWDPITEGIKIGAHADGNHVWFEIYFEEPVSLDENIIDDRWRFGVKGRTAAFDLKDQPAEYDGVTVSIPDIGEYEVNLFAGEPFTFQYNGLPAFVTWDPNTGEAKWSIQQGVTSVWLSQPNPLATAGFLKAHDIAENPILASGQESSMLFRLLAAIGDSGTDFLGNQYRHAVTANDASAVASNFGGDSDTYWFSKPNPSRFAVETLYFDMRNDAGEAQVVDRIYVDPVTPNVYFNVYYSDDGDPAGDANQWEEKIWNHVPRQFKMTKQENHVLPAPITAKYIAIEFSQLQPRVYSPSYFQQPISYKKHPRWVLDYFLARTELDQYTSRGNQFVPRQVGITYNALDLAYNYRLDDLAQEPDKPVVIDPTQRNQTAALLTAADKSGVVDTQALNQLRLVFAQFQQHPAFFSNVRYLLSDSLISITDNYPFELPDLVKQQYDVSALTQINKDSLIYEAGMPVMFFFIPCRHRYKVVEAELSHNRAYFVGVKQIAFSREKYTVANDTERYVETMGDAVNMERTDFVRVEGGGYAVYS